MAADRGLAPLLDLDTGAASRYHLCRLLDEGPRSRPVVVRWVCHFDP